MFNVIDSEYAKEHVLHRYRICTCIKTIPCYSENERGIELKGKVFTMLQLAVIDLSFMDAGLNKQTLSNENFIRNYFMNLMSFRFREKLKVALYLCH